ncbi:MAG: type III restriction-modification system endonuclease [Bacteroidota bacterium]
MKLQFKEQLFQIQAVKAVVDVFQGQPLKNNTFTLERSKKLIQQAKEAALGIKGIDFENELLESIGYRNAAIQITPDQVLTNIQEVQRRENLLESQKLEKPAGSNLGYNLTIEMETGTGKTYTYIRTMYELNKHYGWSKFIVIVPSIAIREGVYKTFEVTQDHFQELYGHKIAPFIYNSSRPQDIENFASDSRISVMIINTQAFNARGADARRIYMELDQFGSRRPIEIISQTNPILIIDEPQSVEGAKTLDSMQDFKPLITLRYSATHRNEYNKIFRLDALDAYNQKLVKKIQVKGINLKGLTGTNGYLYLEQILVSANKPPRAMVEWEVRSGTGHVKRVRRALEKGANFYDLSDGMPQYKNWVLTDIDGYKNQITVNGIEIHSGEALGNVDEKTFRRIQIRETIQSHLQKEKKLFRKGIKVLSLFFIDSVDKYKQYDSEGNELAGEYAKIFEEEYNQQRSEFIDLFNQEYNDYLEKTDPGKLKGYMPADYLEYLSRDHPESVHKGYFSIDKKKKLVDPKTKRNSDESDDISAYDLIMKDKERLLSFEEPTRFIFSHSALKEGWDNPNVFQICALKQSDATIRRRQEVGRGMRLSVNDHGVRLDYETVGEEVHDINKLTIVASESYENFAKGLQKEIADTLKDRPVKADEQFLIGKLISDGKGMQVRINDDQARKINRLLIKAEIVDDDDRISALGREKIESGQVQVPEELIPFKDDIVKLLKTVYSGEALKPENDRGTVTVGVNKNFFREEFRALWDRINVRSIYEVQFDTEKLIRDSKIRINKDLYVSDRTYEVKTGEYVGGEKADLDEGKAFEDQKRRQGKITGTIETSATYDLVGEIVQQTNLTRKTVVEILKSIEPLKFAMFHKNPEEFILKCGTLINEVKASLIINNIVYHKTEERYDAATVFTNDKQALRQSEKLQKHIYDFLISDSKTEAEFAKNLELSTAVTIYAKLPQSFYITTPVARFSPDWAIVFDKAQTKHVYFVAETKGSESEMELKQIEQLKIHCADEHFKAISGAEVKFAKVASYERLLEIIN